MRRKVCHLVAGAGAFVAIGVVGLCISVGVVPCVGVCLEETTTTTTECYQKYAKKGIAKAETNSTENGCRGGQWWLLVGGGWVAGV